MIDLTKKEVTVVLKVAIVAYNAFQKSPARKLAYRFECTCLELAGIFLHQT